VNFAVHFIRAKSSLILVSPKNLLALLKNILVEASKALYTCLLLYRIDVCEYPNIYLLAAMCKRNNAAVKIVTMQSPQFYFLFILFNKQKNKRKDNIKKIRFTI